EEEESPAAEDDEMSSDDPASEDDEMSAGDDEMDLDGDASFSDGDKKTISYIYLFPDSYALKKAKGVVRETAIHLADSLNYDYVAFGAKLFQPDTSASKRDYERGVKRFEEAKALYSDLNMEEAIPKFKSAERIIAKHVDKMADLSVLSEILLYLGASYKIFDETDKASPYFLRYISMNPNKELEEQNFAPEVVEYFNQIKNDFLMMPNGSIKFTTTPPGAEVFLDGKLVGIAPLRVDGVTAGSHYYRLHMDGYRDQGGDIAVEERDLSRVSEDLSLYTDVSFLPDAKETMIDEFGNLLMLKKGVEIGKAFGVNRVLVSYIAVEAGEVQVKNRLFNPTNRSFKEVNTTFALPDGNDFTNVPELHTSLDSLIGDDLGYTPLTSVLDASSTEALLGLDDDDGKGKKKKKSKAWIIWTIVGVVAAGTAVGLGLGLGLKSDGSDAGGAKLKLTFGM
ncbi:PEGA domain-containing protein, partial [bacterium]|nr:PEGA domain-containing protein [bacterium]